MPDDQYDDEIESDEDEAPSGLRKQVKEAQAKAKALESEVATLRRESAFREAGIDPKDPKARYFVKGYEGDLTADAIKAEAEEAGILNSQPSGIPDEEARAQSAADNITSGAEPTGPGDKEAEAIAELNNATSQEEALAVAAKYGVRIKDPLDD